MALAALFAGDGDLARTIEHRLLADHASHLGPWTRLDIEPAEDQKVQTARLAIVAASLGEPVAIEMEAWIAANPPRATTVALERALAARGWAARVAGAPAVAAITVDGTRREVKVDPGSAASLVLTPTQAESAVIEPVSGSLLVVTSRTIALDADSLTAPSGMTLERSVNPAGRIGQTDTVAVTLRVKFGARRPRRVLAPRRRRPFGPRPGGAGLAGRRGPHRRARSDRRPTRRVPRRSRSAAASPGAGATSRGSWTRAPMPWEPAVLQSSHRAGAGRRRLPAFRP